MGYLGNDTTPGTADYFTWLVCMAPQGSVWGIRWRGDTGPDFGKATFDLASLIYQRETRSGDRHGKIDDEFSSPPSEAPSGNLNWIACGTADFYAATQGTGNNGCSEGQFTFIPGGAPTDPLTTIDTGPNDPLTAFPISDGGPGWYRLRVRVNGKHASSTGYKLRFRALAVLRLGDYNGP